MAYDPVRQEIVLYGGQDNRWKSDTWVFSDGAWDRRHPSGELPGKLEGAAMAFDPALQQVVMFGGYRHRPEYQLIDETWTWDGRSWSRLHPPTSPPARADGELAYDPSRGSLVLFGGDLSLDELVGAADDTWSWDGTTWTELELARSPSPRFGHGLSTWGDHLVALGGRDGRRVAGPATWVLGADRWRRLHLDRTPGTVYDADLAWDPVRGEAVLHADPQGVVDVPHTWTLHR